MDDFRTFKWVGSVKYPEILVKQIQELLHFMLSNSLLKDGNLLPEYKKPFDTIYQRALYCEWRGLRDDFRTLDWEEMIEEISIFRSLQ